MSVPASLSSIEDAIQLAEVALGRDDLVAIVDGSGKLVMPVSGAIPPGAVIKIDEILLLACGSAPDHLVFATRRHSGPSIVLESELADWRTMRASHEEHALELTDWLVFLDDGTVLSLAELAGPPAVWGA